MRVDSELRAGVRVERDALMQALEFLRRSRARAVRVSLSYDGRSILVDCDRCKTEVAAEGTWELLVTLRRTHFMALLRVAKFLPQTMEMVVADSRLRVHTWLFETESILDARHRMDIVTRKQRDEL